MTYTVLIKALKGQDDDEAVAAAHQLREDFLTLVRRGALPNGVSHKKFGDAVDAYFVRLHRKTSRSPAKRDVDEFPEFWDPAKKDDYHRLIADCLADKG